VANFAGCSWLLSGAYPQRQPPAISRRSGFFSKPAAQPGPFSIAAIQSGPLIGATNFSSPNFAIQRELSTSTAIGARAGAGGGD